MPDGELNPSADSAKSLETRNSEIVYGEILRHSWNILKSNVVVFVLILATIQIPITAFFSFFPIDRLLGNTSGLIKLILPLANYAFGSLALVPMPMMVAFIVESAERGERLGYRDAVGKMALQWRFAVFVELLYRLILAGGIIAFVVPGFIYSTYFIFSMQSVTLRNKRGRSALYFSRSLVEGRWWEVLSVFLLAEFLAFTPFSIPFAFATLVELGPVMRKLIFYPFSIGFCFYYVVMNVLFLRLEKLKEPARHEEQNGRTFKGEVSIALFCLSALLFALSLYSAWTDQEGIMDIADSAIGSFCCGGLALPLVGLLFGLTGLSKNNKKRNLAIAGAILNGAIYICFLLVMAVALIKVVIR
jgi:hypothetical protein